MANPVDIAPSLGHALLTTQAGFGLGFDAIDDRRFWTGHERGEGVSTFGSFRVVQRGAGANMSVDVLMDEGAYVRGDSVTLQGLYYVAPHSGTLNVDIAVADVTNPRLDLVILEAKDDTHDAGGLNKARVRTVAGTPTAGATLDNRNGAADVPASSVLLADVLVAANDTSITDAEIRDRRPFTTGVPPLLTDVDHAALMPLHFSLNSQGVTLAHVTHDLRQSAMLCVLSRRIVNATRIRWRYVQASGTAVTGNYVIGLYDTSGRRIVDTGSVAFGGALQVPRAEVVPIAATTFEPGLYYVMIGIDTTAGTAQVHGVNMDQSNNIAGPAGPNLGVFSTTGGVTPPTTLLAMADQAAQTTAFQAPPVPFVTLSVG